MATKNKKTALVFDFPEAHRQLQGLEYNLQEAPQGEERKVAFKAYCDAAHAFKRALETLPRPRRCKHTKLIHGVPGETQCERCHVKFVQCTGDAHSNAFIDHCMVCLPWGWGWVPEHTPNLAIGEMVKAFQL